MNLQEYLIIYIVIVNIISFLIMGIDKEKAKKGERRISEKTIFLFALFLGAIGVYAGMQKYRHKTKHIKFVVFIPILIFINIITVYYIYPFLR